MGKVSGEVYQKWGPSYAPVCLKRGPSFTPFFQSLAIIIAKLELIGAKIYVFVKGCCSNKGVFLNYTKMSSLMPKITADAAKNCKKARFGS